LRSTQTPRIPACWAPGDVAGGVVAHHDRVRRTAAKALEREPEDARIRLRRTDHRGRDDDVEVIGEARRGKLRPLMLLHPVRHHAEACEATQVLQDAHHLWVRRAPFEPALAVRLGQPPGETDVVDAAVPKRCPPDIEAMPVRPGA